MIYIFEVDPLPVNALIGAAWPTPNRSTEAVRFILNTCKPVDGNYIELCAAIFLLAKDKRNSEINFLENFIKSKHSRDLRDAKIAGYLCGGHDELALSVEHFSPTDLSAGLFRPVIYAYVKRRDFTKLNELLSIYDQDSQIFSRIVDEFFRDDVFGKNILDDVQLLLRIMTLLNFSNEQREDFLSEINHFDSKIDTEKLVNDSRILKILMEEKKIGYEEALKIFSEVSKVDENKQDVNNANITLPSIGIFNDAGRNRLSFFQKKANKELGISIYDLLSWSPHRLETYFSSNHFHALSSLIKEHKLDAKSAIHELDGLQRLEADALAVLYPYGLRGYMLKDLRAVRPEVNAGEIDEKKLEFMLDLIVTKRVNLKDALKQYFNKFNESTSIKTQGNIFSYALQY